MEGEDLSWFSSITCWSDDVWSDDFVESLFLDDSACDTGLPLIQSSHVSVDARPRQPGSQSSPSDGARPVFDARDETHVQSASSGGRKTHKRQRAMRPKEELEHLRRSVADLEPLLERLRQRRAGGPVPAIMPAHDDPKMQNADDSIWMGVASRQYKYLRASQVENDSLRSQVRNQLHIIQGLTRLVQRAQRGLPAVSIPPPLVQVETRTITDKRNELLARAVLMMRCAEDTFSEELFVSTRDELMEMVFCRHQDGLIPPGTSLGASWLRRRVPHAVETLSDAFWNRDARSGLSDEGFHMEYVEKDSDRQISQLQIHFWLPTGPVRLFGVAVRLRDRNSPCHTIITASSVWPSPSNPPPWNSVGMDMNQWYGVAALGGDPTQMQSEVLVKIHTSKPAYCLGAMAPEKQRLSRTSLLAVSSMRRNRYSEASTMFFSGRL